MNTWLVGSGPMSVEYSKVLQVLNLPFIVIGRGEKSAKKFYDATNINVMTGGIETALLKMKPPETAIIAVGVDELSNIAKLLINAGTKRILLEKQAELGFMI